MKTLSVVILAGGFVGSYMLSSAILDRNPPVQYLEANAKTSSAIKGGPLDVHFRVIRFRKCSALDIQRTLTDSNKEDHVIANYTFSQDSELGEEDYDRTIVIPQEVTTGPATYQVTIKYACNFIGHMGWPIIVRSPKIGFVIKPEPIIKIPLLEIPLLDLSKP